MSNPSDWTVIDNLWEACISEETVALDDREVRSLDTEWGTDLWAELDSWWNSYLDAQPAGLTSPSAHKLNESLWTKEWRKIDPWWGAYVDSQRQQIAKLHAILDRTNDQWERSPSRFNRDPLTTDWTKGRRSHGPLRIKHEEDWSHWLAHLLRASSGTFTHRLFGGEFDVTPQSVRREVQFRNSDGVNRRIDILAEYKSGGLSIEIKQKDTNYGKTPETAALIDEQKHGTWTHMLLLPKEKLSRLRHQFAGQIVEGPDGHPTIVSDEYPDILVLYWRTVSRVLRETLLAGEESDPHWASSAYLFISLIEQHISSFEAITPEEERIITVEKSVDAAPIGTLKRLETVDVTEQLAHFKRTIEGHNEQ